jgi:hypothetical protein
LNELLTLRMIATHFLTSLRRQVAIKRLPAASTENKARLSRFEREAIFNGLTSVVERALGTSSLNCPPTTLNLFEPSPNLLTGNALGRQTRRYFQGSRDRRASKTFLMNLPIAGTTLAPIC